MKILKVIHGYPPRYSAGSEVYSKTLCHELADQGHDVMVFTREEDGYKKEYAISWEVDPDHEKVKLCVINMAHSRDGYRHSAVDEAFGTLLDDYCPDIIHIGHLNHLSTSIIEEGAKRKIPMIFTLHDFWLMCPRGQFLQATNSKTPNLYPACSSQNNEKCARTCYSRYFSSQEDVEDLSYWTGWVDKRMKHIENISSLIDLFIAPSHYLRDRFINDFGTDPKKIAYLDYGFHRERLQGRKRSEKKEFVFGYIGTHKQAKGIHHLIEAFSQLEGKAKLKIWGNPLQPYTSSLKKKIQGMDPKIQKRIEWKGGYRNEEITQDVFNHIDTIVVPSIWGENSPLVIHEAIEAKVPVITANFGGMREYIHHEVNGLLFTHRSPIDLAKQMDRLQKDPLLAKRLGDGGYLQSPDKRIPSVERHTQEVLKLYNKRISHDSKTRPLAYHL